MEIIKKKGSKKMKTNKDNRPEVKKEIEEKVSVPEIEGDRWWWYYVCSECHGMIVWKQEKCHHCGWRIDWNG